MESASALECYAQCGMEGKKDVAPTRPLHLLDLPLDILKTILKEVTHTNDLTTLALTNSTLHGLVAPLIYSRFDIVWPDGQAQTESRTGVDALTFGLATLVMRQDLFENQFPRKKSSDQCEGQHDVCKSCGQANRISQEGHTGGSKLRRGNYYSQFVKKFSLGNGPPDLVQDYIVTKDSGKLLGTMVALAVARMPNLESFVWDMPTGILRDVWMSLSSLGDWQSSKLKAVFIRFHNNRKAYEDSGLVRSTNTTSPPAAATALNVPSPHAIVDPRVEALEAKFYYSTHHVESPNFSILPPLQSISALDVDELANLNELSLLIAKSVDKLRELRVGLASELHSSGLASNSRAIQYMNPRLGCSASLLLLFSGLSHCKPKGKIIEYLGDCKTKYEPFIEKGDTIEVGPPQVFVEPEHFKASHSGSFPEVSTSPPAASVNAPGMELDTARIDPSLKSSTTTNGESNHDGACPETKKSDERMDSAVDEPHHKLCQNEPQEPSNPSLDPATSQQTSVVTKQSHSVKKLHLSTLELERHVMNMTLLRDAIDFSLLTSLTLLKCIDTHALWEAFREWFAPIKQNRSFILAASIRAKDRQGDGDNPHPQLRRMPTSPRSTEGSQTIHRLNLKRLHTDTVSPQLIAFLKETLAPNSLEWLFLQDCPGYSSSVTTTQIYKGPLRRHRGSLTKFMLDSAHGTEKSRQRTLSARKWMFDREILSALLAPKKAPKLRELSISLEYKDWHWFLQQLPNIKGLRSLHIPVIADHVSGNHCSIRDIAMGVVDVINLRKECELAYLAIAHKCFEIVEARVNKPRNRRRGGGAQVHDDDSSGDDITPYTSEHEDEMSHDEQDDDSNGLATPTAGDAEDDVDDDDDASSSDNEDVMGQQQQIKMKLREILFYDDKISIFKARHGKL